MEAALSYADMQESLPASARSNFARAVDEFRAAQMRQLNLPESYISLGDLEVASGNFAAGFAHYDDALRVDAASVRARVNYADALRRTGDDARGLQLLEEGIEHAPDNAALHHSLGLLLVRQKKPDEAIAELRKAVQLEPDNSRYSYVLEVAESELGQAVPD